MCRAQHAAGRKRTEGPQSRAQPSLRGTSTTLTLGASLTAARASSAGCRAPAQPRGSGTSGLAVPAGGRPPGPRWRAAAPARTGRWWLRCWRTGPPQAWRPRARGTWRPGRPASPSSRLSRAHVSECPLAGRCGSRQAWQQRRACGCFARPRRSWARMRPGVQRWAGSRGAAGGCTCVRLELAGHGVAQLEGGVLLAH